MKKRFLSTLLALCTVLALLPGTAWAAEGSAIFAGTFAREPFKTNVKITIKPGVGNDTASVDAAWDDSWFESGATAYNHDLAVASMALSGAAYVENSDRKPVPDSVQNALRELGFGEIISYNYDKEPTRSDNDTVSYTFAYKRIEHISEAPAFLVVIVVKGTSENEEWYSNFNIQTGNTHEGFDLACTELFSSLTDYLDSHDLANRNDINVKFLVTGHSRGAAVANLTAAKLNDLTRTEQKDVYGYTFAAPTVSTEATEKGYENIFNIINGEDFVTRIPLGKWGYRRYGIDLPLPSKSYYPANSYGRISSNMANTYKAITNTDFDFYEGGTQEVDGLISAMEELAPTVDAFYSEKHDLRGLTLGPIGRATTPSEYFEILADYLVTAWRYGKGISLADFVFTLAGDYGPITGFFLINSWNAGWILQNRVFSAHSMAGYYSWLSSCTGRELFSRLNDEAYPAFKRIRAAGPADVYVYDENRDLAASVVNGVIGENALAIGIKNEVKTIDLPGGQEYSIEIIAAGAGSLDYTVEELSASGIGNTVSRTVHFHDPEIETGSRFIGKVNDELFAGNGNYALVRGEGPSGAPFSDVVSGAYYCDAVQWAVENGITSGYADGTFRPGAACTRAQIMTFLWRAAGSPEPNAADHPFLDVSTGAYYRKAALWAVERGITAGTTSTTFSPDNVCTRAQAMTFLYRANGSPAVSGSSGLSDIATDAYYRDAVMWALANHVTNGASAETFSPDNACTRAQIVTFLWRGMAG